MVDGTDDELEPETPEDSSTEDANDSDDGDAQPSNRFAGVKSLSERLDADDDEEDADEDDDLDDDPDPDDDDDDAEGDETESDRESEDSGKPKGESKDDDKEEEGEAPGSARFEIVDSEGSKYDLELPEGATIKFNADGKTVELKSVDALVQMAQKGEAFDRVTARQGQQIGTLRNQNKELADDAEADRELVKALVLGTIDDEELKKLEALFEAEEKDPDARAKAQALAEKRAREAGEKEYNAEQHKAASESFWTAARESISESLPTFPYLDAEDQAEIESRFYQDYESRRTELIEKFVAIAPQHGVSEEDAIREAEHQAIAEKLNSKTLRSVMKGLNDKYAKRAGKGGDGKKEKAETKDAERHNRQIEARRSSSRNPANRSLRSGGSQVNTREPKREKDQPASFEGKIDRSLSKFRRLAAASRSDDDDDDEE